jgi:hypothetical protein
MGRTMGDTHPHLLIMHQFFQGTAPAHLKHLLLISRFIFDLDFQVAAYFLGLLCLL